MLLYKFITSTIKIPFFKNKKCPFFYTRQADSKIPMEKEVIISRQTREKRISIGG